MRIGALSPLGMRDVRRLWAGMGVSLLGDGIFLVAIAWQVYAMSDTPTAMAVVGLAMSLPQAVFLLSGGVVSDRIDRRYVMIGADVLRGLAVAALGLLAIAGSLRLWEVFAIVAVVGVGTAFFLPAFDALVPDIVPAEKLAEANALDQMVRPAALRLAGPALGGVVVGVAGAGAAFLLDAGTFAVSIVAVALVARRPIVRAVERTGAFEELREGIRYVRRHVWLWGTFVSASIAYLAFTGPADVLLPFLVKNTMHGSPQEFGLVLALGGLGALLAAGIVGQRGMPRRNITFMYVTWTVGTLAVAGYGFAVAPWQLMLACLVFNAFDAAGLVVWATTRHRLVPPEMRGRVASFRSVSYGLWPLSYALTGPVVALVGVRATLVGAGLVGGIVTLAFLFLPGMRDIERRAPAEVAAAPALELAVAA